MSEAADPCDVTLATYEAVADAYAERNRKRIDARRLDVRTGDFGGPYDAVLANGVLLHLTSEQLLDTVSRLRAAVRPGGVLAFTVKEGDGAEWTTAKVGRPRYFTYWREGPLRALLTRAGWAVESLQHVAGVAEDWLFVIAH